MDILRKNNVKILGNPDAPQTMVFGHGFGTDQSAWRQVLQAFSGDYRIILYDNVGAGNSDPDAFSAARYSRLTSYADDIIDFCDELKIRDAIYVGHSVSGMVGMLASKKAPDFFSKHIFMNASPRYLNDTQYVGGFSREDLDTLFSAMANNYQAWASGFAGAAMGNPEKPHLTDQFAQTLSAIRPDIALAVAKAIFESDNRRELNDFVKKSLIIQANNDIAVPMEVGRYLSRNISNSKLSVINATGHFPHMSAPDEVIKAIKAFI
jgi:sigma-B regulation protein RsbQ